MLGNCSSLLVIRRKGAQTHLDIHGLRELACVVITLSYHWGTAIIAAMTSRQSDVLAIYHAVALMAEMLQMWQLRVRGGVACN